MDAPKTAPIGAQRLRDMARQHLDEAAWCSDTAQRDALLHQAVAMLAEARRLRTPAGQVMLCADHDDPSTPWRTEQP